MAERARRDEVAALVRAVESAVTACAPVADAPAAGRALDRYLGDVGEITFNGTEAERTELIARLLRLAQATALERRPERDPAPWIHRLERALRSWERDRRRGAADPRARPEDLDRRVAMFGVADDRAPFVRIDTVAMSVAELVAMHALAGSISVEDAMCSLAAIRPLVLDAAALIEAPNPDLPPGVFERPGATLAHVDHAAWQIEQLLRHPPQRDELRWLRALWLELAAALVFARDEYDLVADHGERWRLVQDLAAEKMTVGELRADPAGYDLRGALALARSAALPFAGLWLDDEREPGEPPTAPILDERMLRASAQAILGAWVADAALVDRAERTGGGSGRTTT